MGKFALLFFYTFAALFSFFVAAPCLLNTVSLFGVQKKFNQTMADQGVISAEEIQKIHPKKQIASVIISVLILGLLVWFCFRLQAASVMAILPLILGFFKYRKVLEFNALTARKFYSTYHEHLLDEKKFDKYIKKHF